MKTFATNPASKLAAALAAAATAAAVLVATASSVSAPEPARLNASINVKGMAGSATYVSSGAQTYGYQWPSSWVVGGPPAGAPCSTSAAAAGTTLYSTIQASGPYRKCM